MKVLVLGIDGMLGASLAKCIARSSLSLAGTTRRGLTSTHKQILGGAKLYKLDATDQGDVREIIQLVKPDVAINCIGIVKADIGSVSKQDVLHINSSFPHEIYGHCLDNNVRFIQVSTDCVFSGRSGFYKEDDAPDPIDLYGESKLMGEICGENALTIRTSMIGHETGRTRGLLEWVLRQKGSIEGYTDAYFSGMPTPKLSSLLMDYVLPHQHLSGILNISAERISKYQLIEKIVKVYGLSVDIVASSSLKIDRSLDYKKFRDLCGYIPQSWDDMIRAMYDDRRV